jgi:hypothetical protein
MGVRPTRNPAAYFFSGKGSMGVESKHKRSKQAKHDRVSNKKEQKVIS